MFKIEEQGKIKIINNVCAYFKNFIHFYKFVNYSLICYFIIIKGLRSKSALISQNSKDKFQKRYFIDLQKEYISVPLLNSL